MFRDLSRKMMVVGVVVILLATASGTSFAKHNGSSYDGAASPDVVMEWNMAMLYTTH
jgi:hypothetical protein